MRLRWRILFAVVDALGTLVFRIVRAAILAFTHRARRPAPCGDPKTILLVQLDHLGDAIISTVMLPPLRQRHPRASIEVLAAPWNREVFAAMPEVDQVHVSRLNRFARGRLSRFAWLLAALWWGFRLRRRKIDLAIDVRGDFGVALILWLAGAQQRLGWACGGGGFFLTDHPAFLPGRPEVESRLALLAELGIRPAETGAACLPRFPDAAAARRAVERRLANQGACPHRLAVLHVGAGTPAKQWPAEHWRELLGRILLSPETVQVVLVGSGQDRIIAREILEGRAWPGVLDWTGRLTVAELAALLARAEVMIGADSGPAHLAAAVGTPIVVLMSGTNDRRQWQPRGRCVRVVRQPVRCSPCHRERCPLADHPCMRHLLPDEVAAEVEWVLTRHPRTPDLEHDRSHRTAEDAAAVAGHAAGVPTGS